MTSRNNHDARLIANIEPPVTGLLPKSLPGKMRNQNLLSVPQFFKFFSFFLVFGVFLLTSCTKEEDLRTTSNNTGISNDFLKIGTPTHYVSPNGSNAASGDITHPWLTLSYATSHAITAGNVIYMNAGSYTEPSTCYLSPGVSVVGAGSNNTIVHFTNSNSYGLYLYSSSLENGNNEIAAISFNGNMLGLGAIGTIRRNNVVIHDCTFTDFDDEGVYFGNTTPTTSYASGCKLYNNTFTNCSKYNPGGSMGNINIIGYSGFLCYGNTVTLPKRGSNPAGFGIKTNYTKGLQIYNNSVTITDNDDNVAWAFAMELWNTSDGCDIYSNTFRGAVDFAGDYTKKGSSTYSVRFRNNTVGHTTLQPVARVGMLLECEAETLSDFYVYDNEFKNLQSGISIYTLAVSTFNNIYIYRNTFNSIGTSSDNYWGEAINSCGNAGFSLSNLYIWNNTFVSGRGSNYLKAIQISSIGNVTNVEVKNNIFTDFGGTYITSGNGTSGTITNVFLQYNDVYNCGSGNEPLWGGKTPSNITKTNVLKVNPLFVSTTDFHLSTGSPVIDAGFNVGFPYNGLAPDFGTFETLTGGGSTNQAPIVQNQTFQLNENSSNSTSVGTIVATDPDAGQILTYSILSGNTGGAFAINPTTGNLTVANSSVLVYNTNPSFSLIVKVQDNGSPSLGNQATITVNLLPTNVNLAPIINNQTFSISRYASNGSNVGTVVASDPNSGQVLTFSIIGGNTNSAFSINPTSGKIIVNNKLAFSNRRIRKFYLTVKVKDNGTPSLSSQATVTITIL